MPCNRFLDVDYGSSVLLTRLLDLSFEFVEVLKAGLSDRSAPVVVDHYRSSRISYRTDESKEEIAAGRNGDRVGEALLECIGSGFDSFH
jgi:hypothetical protein